MNEQKQFRSEEARKNYQRQEKLRAKAQKRKAMDAQVAAATHSAKAWLKQHPLQTLAAVAAVILVIVLAAAAIRAVTDPLKGKQDNWLIIDVSGDANAPAYRHLADFDIPEGYTRDKYSSYSDGTTQDFYCIADDKNKPVQDVYITGSRALPAAEFPATILSYGLHKAAGEPRTLTVAGKDCSALYLITDESEYYGDGMNIAHMSFYFDTAENVCVTATLRSDTTTFDQLPDEAAMLAEAERILANLALVK